MKTLIFNGSPRKNGDTISLINILKNNLTGEVLVVSSYQDDISPCIDCRCCWEKAECIIDDYMQDVYEYIKECDNIVIASPIYFSELTGSILNILSRLQMIWIAKMKRNEMVIEKKKKSGIILCGGGDGDYIKAEETAKTLLKHMNARDGYVGCAVSHNTDNRPAAKDQRVVKQVKDIARAFNRNLIL